MIFIDADFFIGFYHEEDAHHIRCIELYNKIDEKLITSWDVIDEVTTKLAYLSDKEHSLNFLNGIKRIKMQIVYPTEKLFTDAIIIFKDQKFTKISLTDCMNMAIAKSLDITTLLSFDQIYEKNGFKLFK